MSFPAPPSTKRMVGFWSRGLGRSLFNIQLRYPPSEFFNSFHRPIRSRDCSTLTGNAVFLVSFPCPLSPIGARGHGNEDETRPELSGRGSEESGKSRSHDRAAIHRNVARPYCTVSTHGSAGEAHNWRGMVAASLVASRGGGRAGDRTRGGRPFDEPQKRRRRTRRRWWSRRVRSGRMGEEKMRKGEAHDRGREGKGGGRTGWPEGRPTN